MGRTDLLNIYKDVLRPSAEYSSVIYHSLIPDYISHKLESVQRQAMKVIYGWDVDYGALLENGTIETLKSRRIDAIKKFALKAEASSRFGSNWFKFTPSTDRTVRDSTRNKYVEQTCRTERGRNNPLNLMTRILNEHHRQ